jgi:hypothetical protein
MCVCVCGDSVLPDLPEQGPLRPRGRFPTPPSSEPEPVAIQQGSEYGSGRISIVGSRYHAVTGE